MPAQLAAYEKGKLPEQAKEPTGRRLEICEAESVMLQGDLNAREMQVTVAGT